MSFPSKLDTPRTALSDLCEAVFLGESYPRIPENTGREGKLFKCLKKREGKKYPIHSSTGLSGSLCFLSHHTSRHCIVFEDPPPRFICPLSTFVHHPLSLSDKGRGRAAFSRSSAIRLNISEREGESRSPPLLGRDIWRRPGST